jgi:hypothetical protein
MAAALLCTNAHSFPRPNLGLPALAVSTSSCPDSRWQCGAYPLAVFLTVAASSTSSARAGGHSWEREGLTRPAAQLGMVRLGADNASGRCRRRECGTGSEWGRRSTLSVGPATTIG